MKKTHFKSQVTLAKPKSFNVDAENGVIKNIVIVEKGEKKNGTYFNDKFLIDLASLGNAQKQGVKSRFGHPNMCGTALGSYLGRYRNFSVKDGCVFGDLYLDPITKETEVEGKGITMFEYVTQMATRNSDMFGNSIHITSDIFEEEIGDKLQDSHLLESFVASDLVDSPAATRELFSNTSDLGVLLTNFLDDNPEVFETIEKNPKLIDDFFETYNNYLKTFKNKDMSKLKELRDKVFGKKKFDIEETTATGEIVNVTTEDESVKVGDKVTNEDGTPVEDGDLKIKDGAVWVIVGGVIDSITESEGEEEEEEEEKKEGEEPTQFEAMMNEIREFRSDMESFKSKFEIAQKERDTVDNFFAEELGKANKRFDDLAKTVTGKAPKKYSKEETNIKPEGELSMYEKVQAQKEAEKAAKEAGK